MSTDETKAWHRLSGEPALWFSRFERYRLTVIGRSVNAVFQQESKKNENPRVAAPGGWYEIAKKWRWEERAAAWDAELTNELEREIEREKKIVLKTGFAQHHRRVAFLNEVAEGLLAMMSEGFSQEVYREFREYLTDIAEEVGERVKKKETLHKGLPGNVYIGFDPDQDGIEDAESAEE
jgi:hypothetical protein